MVKAQRKGDKADLLIDFLFHIFPTVLIYPYLWSAAKLAVDYSGHKHRPPEFSDTLQKQ